MKRESSYLDLVDLLFTTSMKKEAELVYAFINKRADLQLEMEKETKEESAEDDDSDEDGEVEIKRKKIVLKFD